jgi:hypothetical protein
LGESVRSVNKAPFAFGSGNRRAALFRGSIRCHYVYVTHFLSFRTK